MLFVAAIFTFPISGFLAFNLTVHTTDSGHRNSVTCSNISAYYTKLTSFGIIPNAEKSFKFSVKACHDAFVMLSESRDLGSSNLYEFVIGGNRNNFVYLYRRTIDAKQSPVKEPLNCNDERRFTIGFRDGYLTVSNDKKEILIEWEDPAPFNITGYGVRTGYGVDGQWTFVLTDCNRTFGYSCEKTCGHCKSGSICDRLNGSCLNGCDYGWQGIRCDNKKVVKAKQCPCSCKYKKQKISTQNYNRTREELKQIYAADLQKITQELTTNKFKLSSYQRKLSCALDHRQSSKQIGIVGIIFISIVVGQIFISDLVDITKIRRH